MPNTQRKVTESWAAHEEFQKAIRRFRGEIGMRDGEVWIGEVCFGSPNEPWVRVPLGDDSAALVDHAVSHAKRLAADVTGTLQRALQITREAVEKLRAEGVLGEDDLARLFERNRGLEQILEQLIRAADLSPLACHPARLRRWSEILEGSFVPGNPAVEVRVVATDVL